MSSLGHMSPSLLQKVKLGLRPRPPKPKASSTTTKPRSIEVPAHVVSSAAANSIALNAAAGLNTTDENKNHEPPVAWAQWTRQSMPAWLFSTITHVIILLALALMAFSSPEKPRDPDLVVFNDVQDELITEEIHEDIELDATEIDLDENLTPAEAVDVSAVEIADPGALGAAHDIEPVDDAYPGLIGDARDWTTLGDPLGKGETGVGRDGLGPPVSFFGVKTKGRRFMFVVDNSNSMHAGRFETAAAELTKSVNKLTATQEFYIVFYSDMAYPLFYPQAAKTWVKATSENKAKVRSWLAGVHRCLRTNGREALSLAFSMKPDVMYLLGDGAFTDNPIPDVLDTKDDKIVIHTLGFGLKAKGREDFEAVAAKFRGQFHEVAVTPGMVQLEKKINRPRNNKPNGVWGLKLGAPKQKFGKANKMPRR